MHLHTVKSKQTVGCSEIAGHKLSSIQSGGKEKGHVLRESLREKSRACDKLLMELCLVGSSQRTNEQCREPLAARSYWTHIEASMENWQDGIQQQQEPHVLWAPVPWMCVCPALSQGDTFPHPGHPTPLRHPCLPHRHTPLVFPLPCLSEMGRLSRSLW